MSAVLLPYIVLLDHPAAAGAPNACQRTGDSRVTISLKVARHHQGTLIVSSNGELKLKMKGGVDPCGGTLAEIRDVSVHGSSKRDTLTLDRRRGLDGARFDFNMFFGGGWDTLRLLGTKQHDRIRVYQFEGSSPWFETFRWKRVGGGRVFDLQDVVLRGRGGPDLLVGKPSGGPGPFARRTHMHLLTKAGRGSDKAVGGHSGDNIRGGAGNDFLRGGPGVDILRGGTGIDDCRGGPDDDLITGCEI